MFINLGLKQAPLAWNKVIDGHLHDNGVISLEAVPCVYVCWEKEKLAAIGLDNFSPKG